MKRLIKLKRIFILLLIPLSFLITYLAKANRTFAEEVFAKRIYHVYSIVISNITGIFPFSIGEITLLITPILLTVILIRFILKVVRCTTKKDQDKIKQPTRGYLIRKGFLNVGCALSILLFMYTIGCGVNYYRYPFSYYSNLTIQDSTESELKELCLSLSNQANMIRSQITSEDNFGVFKFSESISNVNGEIVKAYHNLSKKYPILSGSYPKAKSVIVSRFMSRMEITGIFWPFTMEANVNVDIPEHSIPATMAHEMAHLRGFMREDEANYIAYLACTSSDNLEIQYSGVILALIISGNALYDKNPDLYYEVSSTYSTKVRIDLNANTEYWRQFENKTISDIADQINNTYLIMNDQEDGVQSYGRMVDLLLAEYRASKR